MFIVCARELAELQKMDVARQSRKQEEALSAEMQAKEEMRLALERAQLDARQQHDGLVMQVRGHSISYI